MSSSCVLTCAESAICIILTGRMNLNFSINAANCAVVRDFNRGEGRVRGLGYYSATTRYYAATFHFNERLLYFLLLPLLPVFSQPIKHQEGDPLLKSQCVNYKNGVCHFLIRH